MTVQYPAGVIEANHKSYKIYVTDWGSWGTEDEVAGQRLSDKTREGLEDKIKKLTKRTARKTSVSFLKLIRNGYPYANKITVVAGTATGLHAANGNVLVTWQNGIKEQITHIPRDSSFAAAMPQEKVDQWIELTRAAALATYRLYEFEKDHKISLKDAVTEALDKE